MSTKDKILDAAERLFATSGFEATSLRSITSAAEVNLAAIHYHFQSKDALVQAVIGRRIGPINARRAELLDNALTQACPQQPSLESILRAFLYPCFEVAYETKEVDLGRLMARIFSEPGEFTLRVFEEHIKRIALRFLEAIRAAVPQLNQETLLWRFFFTVGSMAHTMSMAHSLRALSGGICDPANIEMAVGQLVTFTAAGLKA